MGLFSKPKVPGIDTGALLNIANKNAATQRDILGRKKLALQPLQEQYKTGRAGISAQIEPGAENLLNKYAQDLSGVGAQEKTANDAAVVANRASNFRDVPEIQRAIRESLGGNNLLKSGGAVGQVARPILDAARSSSDFSTNLNLDQLNNESRRSENLAGTGFNVRTDALNKRLGVDQDTLDYLASTGRQDLVDEYSSLAGIEDQLGSNKLGIEQARQANDQAQAAAAASRKGQILSTLGSVAGAGAGALTGNPMAIGLGAQLGGQFGNMAGGGGGGGNFDPTLLYALASRQPANKTAVVRSLGNGNQRVNVGTGRY
jgi:hypothetical protein